MATQVSNRATSASTKGDEQYALPSSDERLCSIKETHAGFFGRRKELDRMHDVCKRCLFRDSNADDFDVDDGRRDNGDEKEAPSDKPVLPVILVTGASGTGKSRLADQLFHELRADARRERRNQLQSKRRRDPHADIGTVVRSSTDEDVVVVNHAAAAPLPESVSSKEASPKHRTAEQPCRPLHYYIIRGKCDEYIGASDPFAALVQALTDFARQLKYELPSEVERIRALVHNALGDDIMHFLVSVIPALSVLQNGSGSSVAGVSSSRSRLTRTRRHESERTSTVVSAGHDGRLADTEMHTETAHKKLQYSFSKLISAISTPERPVLMSVDDMQWASQLCLDLLSRVVCDTTIRNFILVGTIRMDINPHTGDVLELPGSQAMASFYRKLAGSDRNAELVKIQVSNMTKHETRLWLSQALDRLPVHDGSVQHSSSVGVVGCDHTSADTSCDVGALADRLFSKTYGNMFAVIQAMDDLKRNGFLLYDEASGAWIWDFSADDELPLCSSTMHSIVEQVRRLPKQLQDMLIIAAYIRTNFELTVLTAILDNETASTDGFCQVQLSDEQVSELLEEAVLAGLLNNHIGGSEYCFTHDKVQEALHSLIPDGPIRENLQRRIGLFLLGRWRRTRRALVDGAEASEDGNDTEEGIEEKSDEDDQRFDDGLLFAAANLLNKVVSNDPLFLAEMNLQVGQRSIELGGLDAASTYLAQASDALWKTASPWTDEYDTCLRMSTVRAEVELTLGNYSRGEELGKSVLENARQLGDSLPAYLAMTHALTTQGRHHEAFSLAKKALLLLGVYPKRNYLTYVVMNMIRVKMYLRRKTNDQILSLQLNQNYTSIFAMSLLNRFSTLCFLTRNNLEWAAAMCAMIRLTLRDGLCDTSAMAFAMYGIVSSDTGNQPTAVRCAEIAHNILRNMEGSPMMPLATFMTTIHILGFRQQYSKMAETLSRGRTAAMEGGDFHIGCTIWQVIIFLDLLYGANLQDTLSSLADLKQHVSAYSIEGIGGMVTEKIKGMRMLTGEDSIDWVAIEQDTKYDIREDEEGFSYYKTVLYFTRSLVSIYFHKYEFADIFIKKWEENAKLDQSYMSWTVRNLVAGLAAAGMYRNTKKAKHKKQLKSMIQRFSVAAKTKGSNIVHCKLLLEAEAMGTKGKSPYRTKKAYNVAILVASKAGFISHAALACELAGEHFLRLGMHSLIGDFFTHAVQFYQRWGCQAKVRDLESRHSVYIDSIQTQRTKKQTTGVGQIVVATAPMSSQVVVGSHDKLTSTGTSESSPTMAIPAGASNRISVDDSRCLTTKFEASVLAQQCTGTVDEGVDDVSVLSENSM